MTQNKWYIIRFIAGILLILWALLLKISAHASWIGLHPPEMDFSYLEALELEREVEEKEREEKERLEREQSIAEEAKKLRELEETYGAKCHWPHKYQENREPLHELPY